MSYFCMHLSADKTYESPNLANEHFGLSEKFSTFSGTHRQKKERKKR